MNAIPAAAAAAAVAVEERHARGGVVRAGVIARAGKNIEKALHVPAIRHPFLRETRRHGSSCTRAGERERERETEGGKKHAAEGENTKIPAVDKDSRDPEETPAGTAETRAGVARCTTG